MTKNRWDEVHSVRGPKDVEPAKDDSTSRALRTLTRQPEWPVLLGYLRAQEWLRSGGSDEGDAGALFRAAGRRSFLRELEGLAERVRNDAPAGAST